MPTTIQNSTETPVTQPKLMTTLALWFFGVLLLAIGAFSLSLIAMENVFDLKNEMWNRTDNPHTMINVLIYISVGTALVVAARANAGRRSRMAIVAGIAVTPMLIYQFTSWWLA